MVRSSEDIGRGLAPARTARAIAPSERIHVIGAGGAGASAALLLAHYAGADVSGCDLETDNPYTLPVKEAGIRLLKGHSADHIWSEGSRHVDRVAVTKALTSINPDHPELEAARRHDVPLETWQQLVADAAATRDSILVAVSGTQGKTTTSGWLTYLLSHAGLGPSAFVGGLLPDDLQAGSPSTSLWGPGPHFVVEADEYAGNFNPYRAAVGLVLNIEWDHPDVFRNETDVVDAFEAWVRGFRGHGGPPVLVANAGDPGTRRMLDRLADWPGHLVTFRLVETETPPPTFSTGLGPGHEVTGRIHDADTRGPLLDLVGLDGAESTVRLPMPGRYYAQDGLGVITTAMLLGVSTSAILDAVEMLPTPHRRLELKGAPNDVVVLDDYGHHPTSMTAALEAARLRYPGRRLWVVYEPLTHHRTAAMIDEFAVVMSLADEAVVADIWAGRDPDTVSVRAEHLAAAINRLGRIRAVAPGSVEVTADYLATQVRPGDLVITMGGGRSYVIAERLVELLSRPGETRTFPVSSG